MQWWSNETGLPAGAVAPVDAVGLQRASGTMVPELRCNMVAATRERLFSPLSCAKGSGAERPRPDCWGTSSGDVTDGLGFRGAAGRIDRAVRPRSGSYAVHGYRPHRLERRGCGSSARLLPR